MIGNRCFLDTSVIVHAFRSNSKVSEKLDTMEEIYVSVTVIGELYYGAYKSGDAGKHLKQIQSFLNNCKILPTDIITADIYANIKAALSKKGKPIPENDIWIAAIALQYNLQLYTTDGHFNEIDGINLLWQ